MIDQSFGGCGITVMCAGVCAGAFGYAGADGRPFAAASVKHGIVVGEVSLVTLPGHRQSDDGRPHTTSDAGNRVHVHMACFMVSCHTSTKFRTCSVIGTRRCRTTTTSSAGASTGLSLPLQDGTTELSCSDVSGWCLIACSFFLWPSALQLGVHYPANLQDQANVLRSCCVVEKYTSRFSAENRLVA